MIFVEALQFSKLQSFKTLHSCLMGGRDDSIYDASEEQYDLARRDAEQEQEQDMACKLDMRQELSLDKERGMVCQSFSQLSYEHEHPA